MERVKVRTDSLVRAVIVTALVGHWAANALFDQDQYAGAGADLLARLDHPFLIQAAVGLLVVTLLTVRQRRYQRTVVLGRLPLAALLVAFQLLLFLGFESSERIAVDLLAGGQIDFGVFGTGFISELIVAVGAALVLAIVTEAAKRWLGSRDPRDLAIGYEPGLALPVGFIPTHGVLRGAGGVRAPPSLSSVRPS